MQHFDDREPWLVVADRLYERSDKFHQAALEFLEKAKENHLNAAIAIRCNQEATKLDLSLMKVIPHRDCSQLGRSKKQRTQNWEPNPELTDSLLKALFQPEEEEPYAPMDSGSTTETVREDSAVGTVEA